MDLLPPPHEPHDEHPVQEPVPTVVPPLPPVNFPAQVCVEPLYEQVPFAMLHERVHDCDARLLALEHCKHALPVELLFK